MLDTVFMRKPLRADLHIHSQYSDGSLSIAEIVDLYGSQGFDVIAITDHITEKKSFFGKISRKLDLSVTEESFQDYLQEVRIQRERALQKYGMNLIFGYEITKNSLYNNRSCHLLILGLEEYISPDLSVDEILAITDRRDCIVIAAHPFNTGVRVPNVLPLVSPRGTEAPNRRLGSLLPQKNQRRGLNQWPAPGGLK
jgi:3',5'-nucleoside bisphosphate phosphatase